MKTSGISCHGGNDGYAEAIVEGGVEPITYSWNDPANQHTARAVGLVASTYIVEVSDINGCIDTDSIVLTQPDSLLIFQAAITHNLCFGDKAGSIQLSVSGGIAPYEYSWNGIEGNNGIDSLGAGWYQLHLIDHAGCEIDTLFRILEPERLEAIAEITTAVQLIGGSAEITVTANGGLPPYVGTGQFFVSPGVQTFTVVDSNFCTDEVTINVPDAGKLMAEDVAACLGDYVELPIMVYGFKDIVSFGLNLKYDPEIMNCEGFNYADPDIKDALSVKADSLSGRVSIQWTQSTPASIADSGQLIRLIFKTNEPGKCHVDLDDSIPGYNIFFNQDHHQINVQFEAGQVNVIRPATVEIIGDKMLEAGDPLELIGMIWTGNPVDISWKSPGNATTHGNSLTIDHVRESDQGFYSIFIIDKNGCMTDDTAWISVGSRQLSRIEVPSAFTPNGDGLNDVFLAYTNLDIEFTYKMIVFNKWGQQIFESDDIKQGWDGTFNGQPCQTDLYTWVVYFSVPPYYQMEQESPLRGVVMLMK